MGNNENPEHPLIRQVMRKTLTSLLFRPEPDPPSLPF
jgi:hypothetical protein